MQTINFKILIIILKDIVFYEPLFGIEVIRAAQNAGEMIITLPGVVHWDLI